MSLFFYTIKVSKTKVCRCKTVKYLNDYSALFNSFSYADNTAFFIASLVSVFVG